MSAHLSQTQIAAYSERALHPDELLEIDNHLASCHTCHERLSQLIAQRDAKFVRQSSESGQAPFHLDYQQHLQPYADGTINDIDREIVDSHVALCSQCADDLKDLLEFKQAPVAAFTAGARTTPRWRKWWPQLPVPLKPVWATVAAVIAVLLVPLAVLWWTRSPASLEQVSSESGKQGPGAPVTATPSSTQRSQDEATPATPREEPLLVLNDAGGQLTVSKSGHLEGLAELPPDLKDSVERALVSGYLHTSPALTGWPTGAGHLRGEVETQSTFAPLEPTDLVLETTRPTFRWRALAAASEYVVTVYNAKLRQVASSGPVSGTAWTIPTSLARGVTYSWQISAQVDGKTVVSPKPPLPEARFRVLDQGAASVLAQLKQSATGNSHLAMGVFYWKHGLLAESEHEFQALAKANPTCGTAAALLASIRSLRRH